MAAIFKLITLLALFASGQAFAYKVTLSTPPGITNSASAGATMWGTAPVAAGVAPVVAGKISGNLRGEINRNPVEVPAQWGLTGQALSVAMLAIKASPATLVLGSVAVMLANHGLEYIAGQMQKVTTPAGACASNCRLWEAAAPNGVAFTRNSQDDALAAALAYAQPLYGAALRSRNNGNGSYSWSYNSGASWPASGFFVDRGSRAPDPVGYAPATAQDYADAETAIRAAAAPGTNALPDAVANEMKNKGIVLPTDGPAVDITPKKVNVGSPYKDPLTGKTVRDVATVSPSQANPTQAEVQIVKVEVDVNGQPVVSPETGQEKPPEEVKDLCEKNPDASACAQLDEVEDSQIQNRDINLSIVPLPGFGPTTASCPAAQTLFNRGGQAVVWKWDQYCQYSLGIRPLVIGFAWIAAFLIVAGVARRES